MSRRRFRRAAAYGSMRRRIQSAARRKKEKSGQNRLGRLNIFWEGAHDDYFQR
jgi:hypothetical protein